MHQKFIWVSSRGLFCISSSKNIHNNSSWLSRREFTFFETFSGFLLVFVVVISYNSIRKRFDIPSKISSMVFTISPFHHFKGGLTWNDLKRHGRLMCEYTNQDCSFEESKWRDSTRDPFKNASRYSTGHFFGEFHQRSLKVFLQAFL